MEITELENLRTRAELAETKLEAIRMSIVKWQGTCSSANLLADVNECISAWHTRAVTAETKLAEAEKENKRWRENFVRFFIDPNTNSPKSDDSLRLEIAALKTELKEDREHHETIIGLLQKRFPKRPDGTYPDWAIEDVLKENEVLTLANELAEHLRQKPEDENAALRKEIDAMTGKGLVKESLTPTPK